MKKRIVITESQLKDKIRESLINFFKRSKQIKEFAQYFINDYANSTIDYEDYVGVSRMCFKAKRIASEILQQRGDKTMAITLYDTANKILDNLTKYQNINDHY